MEYLPWSFLAYFVIPVLLFFLIRRTSSSSNNGMLPPGPRGLPILGNMLELGGINPHKSLTDLRHKYGPVVWLRIGAVNTMAILSSKASAELFKNHDLIFSDRFQTARSQIEGNFLKGSVTMQPYGSHWRMLRRLMTADMMSPNRVRESASIRRKCVDKMVKWIEAESSKLRGENGSASRGVDLVHLLFLTGFNLLANLVFSRDDLVDPNKKEGMEFLEAVKGLMQTISVASVADYLPWLGWLDPQGMKKRTDRDITKVLHVASVMVKERLEKRQLVGEEKIRDFLDVLLDSPGNGIDEAAKISDISITIVELFAGGTETASSTIEWAMTELLCNPETLIKAKAELNQVIGRRKLEESDIDNLPYMRAIIKETLRLHPPVPFLIPRKAREDTQFMGYFIPKNTQVFVNAYAIGRDPDAWTDEPDSFKPERFIGSKVDYKGHHYEFIPFGAGRRICAGMQLGDIMLHLVLGSLLHQFDWELDASVTKETMDWNAVVGVSMRKAQSLLAIPTKCSV